MRKRQAKKIIKTHIRHGMVSLFCGPESKKRDVKSKDIQKWIFHKTWDQVIETSAAIESLLAQEK